MPISIGFSRIGRGFDPTFYTNRPANGVGEIVEYSEIGTWSEAKLELIRKYGKAYSTILSKRPNLTHAYIDAFAGAGMHVSRKTGELVQGSPVQALEINPPFGEYHFIDVNGKKVEALRRTVGDRAGVKMYQGDCNELLLDQIFPEVRFEDYRRALCLLDPYGLHLDWKVIETAGQMRSIEIFLNFPMLHINRNALLLDPSKAKPEQVARLTRLWGDESWRKIVYRSDAFFRLEYKDRTERSKLVEAFRQRLKDVAGFKYVPEPVVMRMQGTRGPVLYYLFFASPNETANKIVTNVFDRYRAQDQGLLF